MLRAVKYMSKSNPLTCSDNYVSDIEANKGSLKNKAQKYKWLFLACLQEDVRNQIKTALNLVKEQYGREVEVNTIRIVRNNPRPGTARHEKLNGKSGVVVSTLGSAGVHVDAKDVVPHHYDPERKELMLYYKRLVMAINILCDDGDCGDFLTNLNISGCDNDITPQITYSQ